MPGTTRVCCVVLLAVLAVSGCGRDAAGPEQARIDQAATVEIAYTLLAEVLAVGLGVIESPSPGQGTPAVAAGVFDLQPPQTISATRPCEQGGTVSVEGTITDDLDEQGTGTFAMDLRQTPNACVVTTSQGQFTINGDPNLHITANFTLTEEPVFDDFMLSYDGGFRWSGQPGSGSCSMNVTYDIDYANPQASTVSGTMCGYDLSG